MAESMPQHEICEINHAFSLLGSHPKSLVMLFHSLAWHLTFWGCCCRHPAAQPSRGSRLFSPNSWTHWWAHLCSWCTELPWMVLLLPAPADVLVSRPCLNPILCAGTFILKRVCERCRFNEQEIGCSRQSPGVTRAPRTGSSRTGPHPLRLTLAVGHDRNLTLLKSYEECSTPPNFINAMLRLVNIIQSKSTSNYS